MIGAIWAQSPEGVIGIDGKIPWRYSGDLKRFKRVTMGSTIVMGRKTWESIGSKPLPGRVNMTLTRGPNNEDMLQLAIKLGARDGDVWIIGGAEVYAAAMPYVDVIDQTIVPDTFDVVNAYGDGRKYVFAPVLVGALFEPGELTVHPDEPALRCRTWKRR